MAETLYAGLPDIYDAMVDWPKRLDNERPFYRRLFDEAGVVRVLDVACGTGQHAAMFHDWGLSVEAADVSPEMIDRAKATHGESSNLRWNVRSFTEPVEPKASFDAVVCVGNSLALANDPDSVTRAIRNMLAAASDGGIVIVHVLNLWRLPDGPCVWQKCRRAKLLSGEVLIVKGVHRCGRSGYAELIVTALTDKPEMHSRSMPFLGLEAEDLSKMVRDSGTADVTFYGGYQNQPHDRHQSVDLIMVVRK